MFGSSQLGAGKKLFKKKPSHIGNSSSRRSVKSSPPNTIDQSKLARYLAKSGRFDLGSSNGPSAMKTFGLPSSSLSSKLGNDSDHDEDYETESFDEDEDAEGSEVDYEKSNAGMDAEDIAKPSPKGSFSNGDLLDLGSSILDGTPRGMKRSHAGAVIPYAPPRSAKKPRKPVQDSAVPGIARNMAARMGIAKICETDDFIVKTEEILQEEFYGIDVADTTHDQAMKAALPEVSESLSQFWRSRRDLEMANAPPMQDVIIGVGPADNAPALHKSIFLAALLLQLHHPPTATGKQALAITRLDRSFPHSKSVQDSSTPANPTAFPKILVDWMEKEHNAYQSTINEIQALHPNPTAHSNYWDIIHICTVRGKLSEAIRILRRSNFQFARTAREDGQGDEGYNSVQVKNIERVINRAIQVLELCPALQDDNWNVTGNDWILFRRRIQQAMEDLSTFAEARDRDLDSTQSAFGESNFGLLSTTMSLTQSTRRAESRVPWTVYQKLKVMYGILLGEAMEILSSAQDWVEATVGLTVWWNGDDDDDIAVSSLAQTRHSLRPSQSRGPRLVDVNPNPAYLRRLTCAFAWATDDAGDDLFQINSMNPVEVGLASLFEGNVAGVIGLLRGWSLPVVSAVAELASVGGWFETSVGNNLMDLDLDDDDRSLLNGHSIQGPPMTRDTILMEYADALSQKAEIRRDNRKAAYEGWELSIILLSRLDDDSVAQRRVGKLLNELELNSDSRINKILDICQDFNMVKEAQSITERYADNIAESSENYGTALVYYARAHRHKKVKIILDLLISLSLVHSTAFPKLSALDQNLRALLFTPEQSVRQLAQMDPKAAEMLHTYLTGYATLRKFYDLRDEEATLKEGQKPKGSLNVRKSAAATTLLAVISSAADNIHGGLYDENRGSVVQIDGLLSLLGESLVFVNQAKSVLSLPQCFALLKAIEDLQTVTSRVYAQCEACFRSTLDAYQGRRAPAPSRELLKKTMSSMSSSFSLVGSSMLDSGSSNGIGGSGALVKPEEDEKRGWDWRKGLPEGATDEDVLRILRLGLAKDIARHWLNEGG